MRRYPTKRIEGFRIVQGELASDPHSGPNGAFVLPVLGVVLRVIASDGKLGGFSGGIEMKRHLLWLETSATTEKG